MFSIPCLGDVIKLKFRVMTSPAILQYMFIVHATHVIIAVTPVELPQRWPTNILAQRTLWLLVYTIPNPVLYLCPQCGIHIFSRPPNFEQMTLIFSREANFYKLSFAGLNSFSRKFQYDAELEIFLWRSVKWKICNKMSKLFHKFTNQIREAITREKCSFF